VTVAQVAGLVLRGLGLGGQRNAIDEIIARRTDICTRRMVLDPVSQYVDLLHDFYPRGTPYMWLMHGGANGATFYYQDEEVTDGYNSTDPHQGVPTRHPLLSTFENEPAVLHCFRDDV